MLHIFSRCGCGYFIWKTSISEEIHKGPWGERQPSKKMDIEHSWYKGLNGNNGRGHVDQASLKPREPPTTASTMLGLGTHTVEIRYNNVELCSNTSVRQELKPPAECTFDPSSLGAWLTSSPPQADVVFQGTVKDGYVVG